MSPDDFEEFMKKIQQKINAQEEEIYSKKVIQEYRNPTHFGILKNPDRVGEFKGPCNDTMKFSLRLDKDLIVEAKFWTDGCGATLACGNKLSAMIIGRSIKDALSISDTKLRGVLDGLPPEHYHCASIYTIL